jgi:surface protein
MAGEEKSAKRAKLDDDNVGGSPFAVEDSPSPRPPTGAPSRREEVSCNTNDEAKKLEFNDLPDVIKKQFFGFLDVKTLCIAREVSREWKKNCEQAIEDKKKDGAGVFATNKELKKAVKHYYKCKYTKKYTVELAERVAREYGWVIGRWTVSAVTDFSGVFKNKKKFNEDIGDWSVANGTIFEDMFSGCHVFDQDLSKWSMGNAVNLSGMSGYCEKFSGRGLSNWNISNVKDIGDMFYNASSFNGNISSWDTSSVTDANSLFCGARAFRKDVSCWDMSSCTDMDYMFYRALSFNQDLSRLDVSNTERTVTDFRQNLSAWDVSNVVTMRCIFPFSGVTREDLLSWEGWNANEENNYKEAFVDDFEDIIGDWWWW